MISGFDHVVIAVRDLAAGVAAYETLLGRGVSHRTEQDGVATALIATNNLSVELMAPSGDSEGARRLRVALESGDGLKSLVFATRDLSALHRRAERVGLAPEAIAQRDGYASFRFATHCTHGVRLFALQRDDMPAPANARDDGVSGLDHIVVRTADPERAAALYGARLGLDMRLDREIAGRRLMFFRCGDAVVEIIQQSDAAADSLWGLSWRIANADAARERLVAAGVDVSEVRTGMKPGTRVFSVRNQTCGVPTLMIETSKRVG
ncbi:hypothetical protein U91I_03191 [alpha proteobacterium U9-1i]|nr:hypothetical protein U91I_03191 [alpha proteobacterium U9-1i]